MVLSRPPLSKTDRFRIHGKPYSGERRALFNYQHTERTTTRTTAWNRHHPPISLETFPNPRPARLCDRDRLSRVQQASVPRRASPISARSLLPTRRVIPVELKSPNCICRLQSGIFYEQVTNQLDDFVAACKPVRCKLVSSWTPRGGIATNVTCEYESGQRAWQSGPIPPRSRFRGSRWEPPPRARPGPVA